ncbi:hypothetical protein [Paracoccus denitrificans]|nr:hypothetical protein [Paracoccus denitrificans]MBB4630057.1 hypothetical protein [Paracoccus denitrificans]MCU7431411.1 hypothetical protein [Paracoccus denitrificans]WQO33960.1 hypothetical protein U0005_02505 [Paracoccus denitrificans]GEK71332.1 hypothetical protein PDE01_48520 [Paracoccus denitrificans]
MMALHLIEQVRRDLLALNLKPALEKIQEFEKLVISGSIRREHAEKCADVLGDIRVLAGAACDGLAAAQRQLAEIATLSRHLDTYDRQGRRIGNRGNGRQDRIF